MTLHFLWGHLSRKSTVKRNYGGPNRFCLTSEWKKFDFNLIVPERQTAQWRCAAFLAPNLASQPAPWEMSTWSNPESFVGGWSRAGTVGWGAGGETPQACIASRRCRRRSWRHPQPMRETGLCQRESEKIRILATKIKVQIFFSRRAKCAN